MRQSTRTALSVIVAGISSCGANSRPSGDLLELPAHSGVLLRDGNAEGGEMVDERRRRVRMGQFVGRLPRSASNETEVFKTDHQTREAGLGPAYPVVPELLEESFLSSRAIEETDNHHQRRFRGEYIAESD